MTHRTTWRAPRLLRRRQKAWALLEEEPAAAKGRKKTANAKAAKPPAATKKRGPAKTASKLAGQKLITEVLKPSENAGISPEKKVRRMRPSPFNKKSGSVLGRIGQKEDEETSTEKEQVSPDSG